ncbi:MAG TPA: N,N-dimethylformamidase beta subunit family domain-containing protein, partial [Gaiellaceae bacterium]|nr:N,N-dimethylformamidase beta subunit family domain-containing protein [Gaiellaceae bacterium]
DRGQHRAPWVVEKSSAADWLLAGTNLEPGSRIGSGGIEADGTTTHSPRNVTVLAEIPDLYGPGLTAQMTYYETKRGAEVFAAGAFGFTGATYDRRVSRLLANVWARMAGQPAAAKSLPRNPPPPRGHRIVPGRS